MGDTDPTTNTDDINGQVAPTISNLTNKRKRKESSGTATTRRKSSRLAKKAKRESASEVSSTKRKREKKKGEGSTGSTSKRDNSRQRRDDDDNDSDFNAKPKPRQTRNTQGGEKKVLKPESYGGEPVVKWLHETFVAKPGASISKKEAFQIFQKASTERRWNETTRVSNVTFGKLINQTFTSVGNCRVGSNRRQTTHYRNLGLREE